MNKAIETTRTLRIHLLKGVEDLSTEQLNEIPPGFNNNIIWNLAHLVSALQGICYKRACLDVTIDEDLFMNYRPGTKPENYVDAAKIAEIKELLISTVDRLETDYNNKFFTTYTPVMTRYGVELTGIEDAVNFLPFHEGFHMGYIMALKRAVGVAV